MSGTRGPATFPCLVTFVIGHSLQALLWAFFATPPLSRPPPALPARGAVIFVIFTMILEWCWCGDLARDGVDVEAHCLCRRMLV